MAYAERAGHLPVGLKACVACLPVVCGGTIPFFGLTNLLWGSIFGFPGVAFHEAQVAHPLWTDVVWILGWPAIVMWLTGRAADWVWQRGHSIRISAAAFYGASLLVLVPAVPAFGGWPLFLRLIDY